MPYFPRRNRPPLTSEQQEMVRKCLPLLNRMAAVIHGRMPPRVQFDDVVQAGCLGVMDAAQDFDPSHGVEFWTFAARRARGSILDWQRDADWVPRIARKRQAKVDQARNRLKLQLGREPSRKELIAAMKADWKIPASEAIRAITEANKAAQVGTPIELSAPIFEYEDSGKALNAGEWLIDHRTAGNELEAADFWRGITRGLTRAEQLILMLYYRRGMIMKEVGRAIGLSESRVSQMHDNLMNRLKVKAERGEIPEFAVA